MTTAMILLSAINNQNAKRCACGPNCRCGDNCTCTETKKCSDTCNCASKK
jgi:hypothetical protein